MTTPLRRGALPTSANPHRPSEGSPGRKPTCQEEVAARARERTNAAYGSTSPPASARDRVGYASRELDRLAKRLAEQASGLREHGETRAADKLERTADELVALSQAISSVPSS